MKSKKKVRQEDAEREVVLTPTPLPNSKTVVLQISPNNEVVMKPKPNYWCRSLCWICCFSLTFVICYTLACLVMGSAAGAVLYLKFKEDRRNLTDSYNKLISK